MFSKRFTTISIATLATLGAFATTAEQAAARPGGHGFRGHVSFHGGHRWGHRHWGHRPHFGIYGAPLLVSAATYVPECYYVRRRGLLYKVCE